MRVVTTSDLRALADEAEATARRRLNKNLHASYSDPSQRFLNAIHEDSYIRPHRHANDPKTEALIALTGRFGVIMFDDTGAVLETLVMAGEGPDARTSDARVVQIAPMCWHTVLALTPGAVLLEVKAGPFDMARAKEFAPWAPAEGGEEAQAYLKALRSKFL